MQSPPSALIYSKNIEFQTKFQKAFSAHLNHYQVITKLAAGTEQVSSSGATGPVLFAMLLST